MQTDIVISGGGIAGMVAAAILADAGFDVLCVDPAPAITKRDAEGADLRSTAMLQPARTLLSEVGVWARLDPHATPLQTMRIVDAGGAKPEPRVSRAFESSDISDAPFGWNLPNWLIRRELVAHLTDAPRIDYRPGTATTSLAARRAGARVGLSDGSIVECRLVVAADGRNSPMRQAAGIGARTTRYGQKALAFAVTHPDPHGNVSTEIHRTGGPFTLVPLPDWQGKPSSAVVWMEEGPRAEALMTMPMAEFDAAMTERSCGVHGPLSLASRRTLWQIVSQRAERLVGTRLALVAEAAHVMPPIGAQGLNMSLRDIATLRDLARKRPEALGEDAMLKAYERARLPDIHLRMAGISALNRISMLTPQPLRDLRAAGLNALYGIAPVRRTLMQLGLGAGR